MYYINRDTLFCYHKASEAFLQRIMALFVASHYKNTPDDLQLLSDAPAHHIFCLLGPTHPDQNTLPEVLCVVQVCLEGKIAKKSVHEGLRFGNAPSGDMVRSLSLYPLLFCVINSNFYRSLGTSHANSKMTIFLHCPEQELSGLPLIQTTKAWVTVQELWNSFKSTTK